MIADFKTVLVVHNEKENNKKLRSGRIAIRLL